MKFYTKNNNDLKAKNSPLITIGIPTFNSENVIINAIKSIELQPNIKNLNYEIIIYDDGSVDNTPNIVNELSKKNPNIRFFVSETNCGIAETRSKIISLAKGEFFVWLDSDDILLENSLQFISKTINKFSSKKEKLDIIICNAIIRKRNKKPKYLYKNLNYFSSKKANVLLEYTAIGDKLRSYPWSFVCQTRVLKKAHSEPILRTSVDDQNTTYKYFRNVNNIATCSHPTYCHIIRPGSDSHNTLFFQRLSKTYDLISKDPILKNIEGELKIKRYLCEGLEISMNGGDLRKVKYISKKIRKIKFDHQYFSKRTMMQIFLLKKTPLLFYGFYRKRRRI